MNTWVDQRRAAVLLHITSLPGPFHRGVLGQEAFRFIDGLVAGGFSVWQFLPLGPTHGHGSPYESLSTFAGNSELLDLRDCVNRGWLNSDFLSVEKLAATQHTLGLNQAGKGFWLECSHNANLQKAVDTFHQQQAFWLDDFALFTALKLTTQDSPWWAWDTQLRQREPEALEAARAKHHDTIQQILFEQFLFDQQWHGLKTYAESKNVQLFGDLPIYVAHDSSDVWANQGSFTLNDKGLCTEVAGVPPDYFSETGQRWGNPLYRWDVMQQDNFAWWNNRVTRQLETMHMLRIDHFRGLESFWAIPGDRNDGIKGEWRPAPGLELLTSLQKNLGTLPLIAEDLGIITDKVTKLRTDFGLPGMKILQFAFGGDTDNPYLPENHEENSVVYTGTHDNDTTMGWFESADKTTQKNVLKILKTTPKQILEAMLECTVASPAKLCVLPMQDLLGLGSDARFNTPGTLDGNWDWRLESVPTVSDDCWQHTLKLNQDYKRT